MNDRTSRLLGALVIAMGAVVFFANTGPWRFRGLAYAGYGIFMIGRTLKVRNER